MSSIAVVNTHLIENQLTNNHRCGVQKPPKTGRNRKAIRVGQLKYNKIWMHKK